MNALQKANRQILNTLRKSLIGSPPISKQRLSYLTCDPRYPFFRQCIDFINYEKISGDILEFGVFTGRTLAAFTNLLRTQHAWSFEEKRVIGFDWFQGLSRQTEPHSRWNLESCTTNHEPDNPVASINEPVSREVVERLFRYLDIGLPILEIGDFEDTIPSALSGGKVTKAAIIHIDCDLYESTASVLRNVASIIQDGTIILFDDWFHYKGNKSKGESRAFSEFLEQQSHALTAQPYHTYGTFCKSFIMSRL
jgi:hypothetical protein